VLLLSAHTPEERGSRVAEELVNSLKEVEFPVSHFTSRTMAQLPSLGSICATCHAPQGTHPISPDQAPHKEFQSFLHRTFSAAIYQENGFHSTCCCFPLGLLNEHHLGETLMKEAWWDSGTLSKLLAFPCPRSCLIPSWSQSSPLSPEMLWLCLCRGVGRDCLHVIEALGADTWLHSTQMLGGMPVGIHLCKALPPPAPSSP